MDEIALFLEAQVGNIISTSVGRNKCLLGCSLPFPATDTTKSGPLNPYLVFFFLC